MNKLNQPSSKRISRKFSAAAAIGFGLSALTGILPVLTADTAKAQLADNSFPDKKNLPEKTQKDLEALEIIKKLKNKAYEARVELEDYMQNYLESEILAGKTKVDSGVSRGGYLQREKELIEFAQEYGAALYLYENSDGVNKRGGDRYNSEFAPDVMMREFEESLATLVDPPGADFPTRNQIWRARMEELEKYLARFEEYLIKEGFFTEYKPYLAGQRGFMCGYYPALCKPIS